MEVVAGGAESETVLYVVPNLAHFEVRVVLNYLDFLFVSDVQFVLLERSSQNDAKYNCSQVELLHLVFYALCQVGFSPCILTLVNLPYLKLPIPSSFRLFWVWGSEVSFCSQSLRPHTALRTSCPPVRKFPA